MFEPFRMTDQDRVLLHLDDFREFEGKSDVPHAVSQSGISDRTSLVRSHIPRTVKGLVGKGLAKEAQAHISGGERSRRVYFLTWEGAQNALDLRKRLCEHQVEVLFGRRPRKVRISEIPQLLGIRAEPLDIFIASERGPLTAGSFSGQRRSEGTVENCEWAPTRRPFFGRDSEIRQVMEWLNGGARLVMLRGIAGIGKTSTALRIMDPFRGKRHIIWLALHEWDGLPNLLRPLADFLSRTGRGALFKYLGSTRVPEVGAVGGIILQDFEDLEALVVVDDLQKASGDVLEGVRMLSDAALRARGPRLLLLSREKRQLWPPAAISRGEARELLLSGLEPENAAQMLTPGITKDERERILSAAGGNPLFIELLSMKGLSAGRDAVWEHIGSEMLARLEKDERSILGLASVHGYPVPAAALMDDGNPGALENLSGKSLLFRTAEGNYGMHDLLREFFYSHLSSAEREAGHRRAARFLLEGGQPGPMLLMDALRHLMRAGERDSAARLSLQAGEALVAAGLGPALLSEVLDRIAPPEFGAPPGGSAMTEEGWRGLCLLRAGILSSKGEWDRALREYMKAAESGGPLAADALCGAGGILEGRCDWEGAAGAYSRALSVSESVRPEALRGSARVLWRTGKWNEALARFTEALQAARRTGRRDLEAALLTDIGNLEDDRGEPAKALARYSEALRILEEIGISKEAARVHNNIGAVHFYGNKWDQALEHYQRSLELSERAGDSSTAAYAQSNIGQVLARRGETERALRYLDASTRTFERLGDAYMQSTNLLARGILHRTLKDTAKAEAFFRQGIGTLEALNMPRELAEANYEFALCIKTKGNRKEARRLLESAVKEFRRLGAAKELRNAERELKKLCLDG